MFPKSPERAKGNRNRCEERLEVKARKRKNGDEVELDCLLGRGRARGIIYKYATRGASRGGERGRNRKRRNFIELFLCV